MEFSQTPHESGASLPALSAIRADSIETRQIALRERLQTKLAQSKNALIIGVGGGNDSVSALFLRSQLAKDFGFQPKNLDIAAMLPDVLSYTGCLPHAHRFAVELTPDSERFASGRKLVAFPEPLLAKHKDEFGIGKVLGLSLRGGSAGLSEALSALIAEGKYDLVLACDVGGDFIAVENNLNVLSPMMDGMVLAAFREVKLPHGCGFASCVFGLGTDGESTTMMLEQALRQIVTVEGCFDELSLSKAEDFYRNVIENNRASRTADFTLRSIHGEDFSAGVPFRVRFYTEPYPGMPRSYEQRFDHKIDSRFSGRYYLFDSLEGLTNPYAQPCANPIEWFLRMQELAFAPTNELNGQVYRDVSEVLLGSGIPAGKSLYFGTPPALFLGVERAAIVEDIIQGARNRVFDAALMYRADLQGRALPGLTQQPVGSELVLLSARAEREMAAALQAIAENRHHAEPETRTGSE